jgi:spoIIIJ-associated protein
VSGGNSAVLIGKRGQTLEAIQYLVEKIVNKNRKGRVGIHVDVEGYLEKRRIRLQRLAVRMAEKVKSTGKPSAIGQMNAHDRRIVHIALQDDNRVRTQSKGEGFLKKLVIFPKKNSSSKQR